MVEDSELEVVLLVEQQEVVDLPYLNGKMHDLKTLRETFCLNSTRFEQLKA